MPVIHWDADVLRFVFVSHNLANGNATLDHQNCGFFKSLAYSELL